MLVMLSANIPDGDKCFTKGEECQFLVEHYGCRCTLFREVILNYNKCEECKELTGVM